MLQFNFSSSVSQFIMLLIISSSLLNCGSYQLSTYDSDGIYNSKPEKTTFYQEIAKNETSVPESNNENRQVVSNNNAYYKHVFSEKAMQYQVNDSTQDVFTDVNTYSSSTNNPEEINSYGGWGENPDNNITVNINTNPWNYNYWGDPFFYWGFNYWNSPFFFDPFYPNFYGGFYGGWYGGFYNNWFYPNNIWFPSYNTPYYRTPYNRVNGRRTSTYGNAYAYNSSRNINSSVLGRSSRNYNTISSSSNTLDETRRRISNSYSKLDYNSKKRNDYSKRRGYSVSRNSTPESNSKRQYYNNSKDSNSNNYQKSRNYNSSSNNSSNRSSRSSFSGSSSLNRSSGSMSRSSRRGGGRR